MTDFIYSLNITTVGDSPTCTVTLHKTIDDATESLKDFLKNDLTIRKNKGVEYEIDYLEEFDFKHLFVLTESGDTYVFNENSEILVDDISLLHEYFCQGEFIPYKWTYEIQRHNSPHKR